VTAVEREQLLGRGDRNVRYARKRGFQDHTLFLPEKEGELQEARPKFSFSKRPIALDFRALQMIIEVAGILAGGPFWSISSSTSTMMCISIIINIIKFN
jgi:hypothetical protein